MARTIWVKGYTKRDGTKVRGYRRKDLGNPGKGPKVVKISHPGSLGIKKDYSDSRNRAIIRKDERKYGHAETVRKINALYVFNKNTDKTWARRLRSYM